CFHVLDDRRDRGRLVGRDHAGEIVDVSDRIGELQSLRLSARATREDRERGGNEERERAGVHGRRLSGSFPWWKHPGVERAPATADWRGSSMRLDSRTTMSYRSPGRLWRGAVELAAAGFFVVACSHGDAPGSSGKSAAATTIASTAAPATATPTQ